LASARRSLLYVWLDMVGAGDRADRALEVFKLWSMLPARDTRCEAWGILIGAGVGTKIWVD
jgi:hypothetical protein